MMINDQKIDLRSVANLSYNSNWQKVAHKNLHFISFLGHYFRFFWLFYFPILW